MRVLRLSYVAATWTVLTFAASSRADPPVLLTVDGAVQKPLVLTADDLAKFPRVTAKFERDGETSTYEGVLLYDLLVKAGVPFGRAMTGKPMASYILAVARDGYAVVIALPEIDPAFMGAQVVVADKRDGGPLPGPQQPLQLITPQDKLHARSVYSLSRIEVVRLRP
jgi:hypothetical protein